MGSLAPSVEAKSSNFPWAKKKDSNENLLIEKKNCWYKLNVIAWLELYTYFQCVTVWKVKQNTKQKLYYVLTLGFAHFISFFSRCCKKKARLDGKPFHFIPITIFLFEKILFVFNLNNFGFLNFNHSSERKQKKNLLSIYEKTTNKKVWSILFT